MAKLALLDRAAQVNSVLTLVEGGMSENAACEKVGINRATFRAACVRVGAGDDYARATEALARDQVEKVELVIAEMRNGDITPEMARIEIDTRKWFASKLWKPQWGDARQVELSGSLTLADALKALPPVGKGD